MDNHLYTETDSMSDKQSEPEKIDEVDALNYEKLALQLNNLALTKQLIETQLQGLSASWNAKYSLTEKDSIDLQTRVITRAPAEKAAEKPAKAAKAKPAAVQP